MKDGDTHGFDDAEVEHDPEDLAHSIDTEDVAMQKLARRMSKIMRISELDLLPRLRRLVAAEQLRNEVRESKGSMEHSETR